MHFPLAISLLHSPCTCINFSVSFCWQKILFITFFFSLINKAVLSSHFLSIHCTVWAVKIVFISYYSILTVFIFCPDYILRVNWQSVHWQFLVINVLFWFGSFSREPHYFQFSENCFLKAVANYSVDLPAFLFCVTKVIKQDHLQVNNIIFC